MALRATKLTTIGPSSEQISGLLPSIEGEGLTLQLAELGFMAMGLAVRWQLYFHLLTLSMPGCKGHKALTAQPASQLAGACSCWLHAPGLSSSSHVSGLC